MSTISVANGDVLTYTYTGAVQTETLPPGTYQLECWGAQGGDYSTSYLGGRGGYSIGVLTLEEDTDLFIYVGGQGVACTRTAAAAGGGFNGGGDAYGNTSTSYSLGLGGGGGSDIRIGTDSLYARVIVAGGGGGQSGRYHYSSQSGHGGGASGGNANSSNSSYIGGGGASQTAVGTSYSGSGTSGSNAAFGQGADSASYLYGPGGGGWYGGGRGNRTGGGGGSGYVYTSETASNYPSGCLLNSNYYLTDASTTIGTTSGRAGDGEIIITVLSVGGGRRQSTAIPDYEVYEPPTLFGAYWDGSVNSSWLRTDDSATFADPVPAVNNGDGSSPFDSLMPWAGMQRVETTEGGVEVSIPKFWYKWTRDDQTTGDMKLQISNVEREGFYVSPAHADRGDGAGERDVVYVGAYHCASSTYKSTSGVKPQASITRATARTNISNLGAKYWQFDYAMLWTIQMLYLVEYANWNSQATIGYGCGNGSAAENSGLCDAMTYHTGTNAASRTTYGHVRYRYIEDLWANVYDWCDGIYFDGSTSNVYCIKNPASFSDTTGGTNVGTRSTTSGCITGYTKPSVSGFEYALFPSSVSGTDYSIYVCDRYYYSASSVCIYVGGFYSQYQNYGLFYSGSYTASSTYAYIGARLQRLPQTVAVDVSIYTFT